MFNSMKRLTGSTKNTRSRVVTNIGKQKEIEEPMHKIK